MNKILAGLALAALTLSLTGCGNTPERTDKEIALDRIEIGKVCFEAGGDYTWSEWSGWKCEFKHE